MKIKMSTIESDFIVPMFRVEVRDSVNEVIMIHECVDIHVIRDSIIELQRSLAFIPPDGRDEEPVITKINDQKIDLKTSWRDCFFFLAGQLSVQAMSKKKSVIEEDRWS